MAKKSTPRPVSGKELASLRAELRTSEAKKDRWKKRAKQAEATAADLRGQLRSARKKLDRAAPATSKARPAGTAKPTVPAQRKPGPDDSWTVVRLRDEG